MIKTNVLSHLAAAAIVTILSMLIYVSVQQAHRTAANDPQLQIATDIANRLRKGAPIDKWFNNDTIDISQSLSVFSALFDNQGEPVISTGVLNGKMPHLPEGVFDLARKKGENIFTWQPQGGVRIAIVLRSLQSSPYSFVATGRSLNETEKREQNLQWMTLISWLLCMGIIGFHWIMLFFRTKDNS